MPYVYDEPQGVRYVYADEEPAVTAGKNLNSIPRQIGLTARYGLEGLANTAQLLTEPLRYLTDKIVPDRTDAPKSTPLGVQATKLADFIGLPSPNTPTERVVGDATRLLAGNAGIMKLGQYAPAAVAPFLTENPIQQLMTSAGAGLAGGASREAGGGPWQQALSAAVGGIGAGLGASAIRKGASYVQARMTPQADIDQRITAILQQNGIDWAALPRATQETLRNDLRRAMQTGEELNAEALRRLADFRTVGATPTRGMLTLDPVQVTAEKNLAKIGANSQDAALQGLPRVFNENNQTLIRNMNNVGGASEANPIAAGNLIVGQVNARNNALNSAESAAWDAARSSPSYRQPIYPDGINAMNRQLGEEALMGYLPKQISDYAESFLSGQQPFTPQHYRNLRSMLSNELAKGGNEAAAARAAIRGLDSVEIRPIVNPGGIDFGNTPVTQQMGNALRMADAQAGESINLIDQARAATAAKYRYQEGSPLVRTVLGEGRTADPERLANSYVINGSLNDARRVLDEVGPGGVAAIKDVLATHIKRKALSGAADEVGNVSQSKLNSALRDIGMDKLRLFFSPEELAQLQATGRVASYMQHQPIGSAVNNSNSGALMVGKAYDVLKGALGSLPGGSVPAGLLDLTIGAPTKNANNWLNQRRAMDITDALIRRQQMQSQYGILAPTMGMAGLLSAPQD